MKKRISLVVEAHQRVSAKLHAGEIAIDATVGNGYDTRFLLQRVAPMGRVYGFDIQDSALDSAKSKINEPELLNCLILIHASHASMVELIPKHCHGHVCAVMFNLGYLPGSDKTVMTQVESTLAALTAAAKLLTNDGILTIVAYPGHPGGEQETAQVADWCAGLEEGHFEVELIEGSTGLFAPKLFVVNKIFQTK